MWVDPIVLSVIGAGLAAGLASVPHCAAMCGPLSAALCGRSQAAAAPVRYQVGRFMGYGFGGLLAGQLGHALGGFKGGAGLPWLMPGMVVCSCLWLAFSLWRSGARPEVPLERLVRGGPHPSATPSPAPGLVARVVSLLPRDPTVLGGLTVLLPCGALYAALLLAAATGRGEGGALLMLGFAVASGAPLWAFGALVRFPALAPGRHLARSLALLLILAAGLTVARPIQAAHQTPAPSSSAPSCH